MVYGLFFNLTYKRSDIFPKPTALREGRPIPCCYVPKCCEITARGDYYLMLIA